MKKKHYSTLLKEEIAKLRADIYKVIDGDIQTIAVYKMSRKANKDFEELVWFGSITKDNEA